MCFTMAEEVAAFSSACLLAFSWLLLCLDYGKIYLHSHKVLKIAKEVRQFHFPVGKVCLLLCYPTLAGVTFAPFH